jgi:glycosyltransferase involved in cell wall biosynthesis
MMHYTAIVVTYNEAAHLPECLAALDFCEEKIVIDLGSTDTSREIAQVFGCRVIEHERVDIVEQIRAWAISQARNDWIVFMDPDEIFPRSSLDFVERALGEKGVGGITFERLNYFIGQPIRHGRWYGKTGFPRIFHKDSVILSASVHDGLKRKKEYIYKKVPGVIKHYWIDSLEQFYEKHTRYLKFEGESRYKRGQRFSTFAMYKSLGVNFIMWYIVNHGFMDTVTGWQLITLALWYEKNAWISLKEYQQRMQVSQS